MLRSMQIKKGPGGGPRGQFKEPRAWDSGDTPGTHRLRLGNRSQARLGRIAGTLSRTSGELVRAHFEKFQGAQACFFKQLFRGLDGTGRFGAERAPDRAPGR